MIFIASILVMGLVFSGLALAGGPGKGDRRGFGFKPRHSGGGLMLLANYQQKNLVVRVLSEMSGQSTEAISTKLKEQRMRTVMQELNIDRQTFHNAMQTAVKERIKQAVAGGTITAEQENEILSRMENRFKRRELMSKLIEKGIENGTITQDEAQMLMRKRR